MAELEVINIGESHIGPTINISESDKPSPAIKINESSHASTPKSVNFGPGIEMLMNDKNKGGSRTPTSDINMTDLDKLEKELNNLSSESSENVKISRSDATKKIFSNTFSTDTASKPNMNYNSSTNINASKKPIGVSFTPDTKPNIATFTSQNGTEKETWDGFKKFSEIPIDPTIKTTTEPVLSKEELLRKKFEYLRKLEKLERKGVKLSKKYTMESSLMEMQGEYEMIIADKERQNSIKFQGKMMMAAVTGLEYLNSKFDPFDINLDGWGESVTENMDDYDEIFAELHEKYKSKAKMAPELKLLFQLGGSAIMVHMTNTMFKSAMPGMNDIMRQNPDLMRQFTSAAVNTMGQNNPGFGGFMNGITGNNGNNGPPRQMPPMGSPPGPPQPDLSTLHRPEIIPPGPPSSRPDIGMSRGRPNFNDAVNMEGNFGSTQTSEPIKRSPPRNSRPDMKGPRDISDLLSGLKTKKINIKQKEMMGGKKESSSMISIDELKKITSEVDNMPRRSKRRPRSEKNTVSLNI
jgi:hypothetical protein